MLPRSPLIGLWALCWMLSACSPYDASRLYVKDAEGRHDSGADAGGVADAGDAGGTGGTGGTGPNSGVCGDGKITGDETCDTGYPPDTPGACPTSCTSTNACVPHVLMGTGCQIECVGIPLGCAPDDQCCPATCDASTDNDCSATCGDKKLQTATETCEAGTDKPCPTLADCDDSDPCTIDTLVGSEKNCNAACEHERITALKNGDMCCPPGANANNDTDCKPVCGNSVKEPTEECDGETGCGTDCLFTLTAAQKDCVDKFATGGDFCARCACRTCTTQVTSCRASGDAARDGHCSEIAICGAAHGCPATKCYCGTANYAFPSTECATSANGPCKTEIENAAKQKDAASIFFEQGDVNTAINRATVLLDCEATMCKGFCKFP